MNVFLTSGGQLGLIIGGVVLLIILLIALWYIRTLNTLRTMGVKIDESESGIDVALTKRFDLLTKMVDIVKGYAKHEKETLEKVISMRKPSTNATLEEKQEFANAQAEAIKQINVVAEAYPDLKASANFKELQSTVRDVEEQLQAARRVYNSNVSSFNQMIVVFPTSIVANSKGLTKRKFFEAEEQKRQDVKMDF